jgi:uncharacterized protein (TIRG00374 family)
MRHRLPGSVVLIMAVLSVALLASLFTVANASQVLQRMESFQRTYLPFILVAMVWYELARTVQWIFLLRSLQIRAPLQAEIFSFAVGEFARILPAGNYFQNYLLRQAGGSDFGRTSAATTLSILTEVALCLVAVTVLGVGTWTVWLRPLILIGLCVAAIVTLAGYRLLHGRNAPGWMTRNRLARLVLAEWRQFRSGTQDMLHPRILARQALLGAAYVLAGSVTLYLVMLGMGMHLPFWDALRVYCFSLGFSLIFPLPSDLGVIELSGVGAFLALGLDRDSAVSAMLINRVVSLSAALLVALLVIGVLRGEIRPALGLAEEPPEHADSPPGNGP